MMITKYRNFLNEELKVLKGPTDEETMNVVKELKPIRRILFCMDHNLSKKFYPSDEEIKEDIKKCSPLEKINFCINNVLDKKFFPPDDEVFSIDLLTRTELCNNNKLDKKFYPSLEEMKSYFKGINSRGTANDLYQFIMKNHVDDLDLFMIAVSKGIFKVVSETEIINRVISNGLINIMKFLLLKKVKINEFIKYGVGDYGGFSYNTIDGLCGILTPAIVNNQKEMIEFLIDKGADINADQYIIYAIINKPELIQYLIDKGADVNKIGRYLDSWIRKEISISSFEVAIKIEKIDIAKLLIKNGFELNRTEINRLWSKYRFVRESEKYLRYLLRLKKYST